MKVKNVLCSCSGKEKKEKISPFIWQKREVAFLEQPLRIHHKWTSHPTHEVAEEVPCARRAAWLPISLGTVPILWSRKLQATVRKLRLLYVGDGEAPDGGPQQQVTLSRQRTRSQ